MAAVAALIAALAIGGGTAIAGGIKAKKAKQAAALNAKNRPVYQTPQSEFDTLSLLENRASQGLSDNSKQYYQQNQDRALTAGINGILQGGGSVNNIDSLLNQYSNANGRLALANDEAQVKNIYSLIGQRQRMADYQDKQFQINDYAPFADRAQQFAQERAQGQGMVSAGLNTAGSGIQNFIGTLGRKQQMNQDTQLRTTPAIAPSTTNNFPAYNNTAAARNAQVGYSNNNNYGFDLSTLSPEDYQTVTTLLNK